MCKNVNIPQVKKRASFMYRCNNTHAHAHAHTHTHTHTHM